VRTLVLLGVLAGCHGDAPPPPTEDPAAAGSSSAPSIATAAEREAVFLRVPTAKAVRATIERLSAKPHVAGSPANGDVARDLLATLGRLGIRVGVTEYHVYLPYPRTLSLTVRGKQPLALATVEASTDPAAPELLGWNAYSASGTVAAPVVYAGQGRDQDFAALRAAGVDPAGKVVLLRYGPLYRGAQVARAERHGAAAVIFYVDPQDEPDRPRDSVQRGTVVYYWQYTGDPLTPGIAAGRDAARIKPADAQVLPKIPVLNITANEAEKLLDLIGGPPAPADLAGGLHGPYHLGPGPVTDVHVELDGQTRVIRDLIAVIPGHSPQGVVLGNHYDAWGHGALDPHSGTATLIEIARGFTALSKAGWKPRRTIVLAFWDAEELGVIGSTEWVEDQLDQLRKTAVAYFNIDTIKAGPLTVQASPALRELVRGCAADVIDPGTAAPFVPTFKDPGIGSDWTAFLHHAGVPVVQWQSGPGKGVYTVWHSLRDDAAYAGTRADPDFAAIPSFAKVMGLCALRLADAETLPLRYSETARWLDDAITAFAASTKLKLDRTALDAAVAKLAAAAAHAESPTLPPGACNQALIATERGFLADDGLVGRPWYRHLAIGPDPDNGYAALLLPELAAARTQPALDRATTRLAAAIARAAGSGSSCAN
jgi:N-acetylated-alpha-linked acidic dipeptidase